MDQLDQLGPVQQDLRDWGGLQDEELQQPQTILRRGSVQREQSAVQTVQHLQVRGGTDHLNWVYCVRCINGGDFRAEQCQSEFYMAAPEDKKRPGQVWIPFENEDADFKCKLACYNRDTKVRW